MESNAIQKAGARFTAKLCLVMGIVLFSSACFAGPFLVCDSQTGVDHYKLTGPAWVPVTVMAQADGSIKMDVSAATVGSNSLTVAACRTDAIWGELCSSTIPFSFTRPSPPTTPVNTKLSP